MDPISTAYAIEQSVREEKLIVIPEWKESKIFDGKEKYIVGSTSFWKRHCRMFMRKIILFTKTDTNGVRNQGCVGWICPACGESKFPTIPMPF